MLWSNFKLAAVLFFGWFLLDSIYSIFLTSPLEGIYYPAASGRLKSIPGDWSQKPWYGAPMYFVIFSVIWLFLVKKEGKYNGLRLSALITAFVMAPFWIVSSISADMYDLQINSYWLITMIYSNISFFIFGFIGKGSIEELHF